MMLVYSGWALSSDANMDKDKGKFVPRGSAPYVFKCLKLLPTTTTRTLYQTPQVLRL